MPSDREILVELINILKDLLSKGDWSASLFLKTAYKKIDNLCQRAEELLNLINHGPKKEEEHINKESEGYLKVFVSVYQSDYNNLTKWQNTLLGITEYSVSRPIYRNEEYIEEIIRARQSFNEGYAIVFIRETDIIPPYAGKPLMDKFGHELLTVKQGAILPENIFEFVHLEKRYFFRNGRLLLKSS